MDRNRLPTYVVVATVAAVVLAVAGVPLASLLPFAVLLACPLMMVFMMRGMHGSTSGGGCGMHGSHNDHASREDHAGLGRDQDPTRSRESQH